MAVKGWRIIWIVICLFQPWANQVDIALGMRRALHNRCAHVQSVPSPPWGRNTKALFSPPSSIPLPFSIFLSPSHHLSFLTFEMGIASSHQFTSLWSLLCVFCFHLHSSIKGETGKSWSRALSCQRAFWWRPVATSESISVGARVLTAMSIVYMQILRPVIRNRWLTSTTWSVLFSVVYI